MDVREAGAQTIGVHLQVLDILGQSTFHSAVHPGMWLRSICMKMSSLLAEEFQ